MRKATLAIFVMIAWNAAAAGSSITSVDPSSIKFRSGEYFMTVHGSSLGNVLVYDGPAGYFEVDVNASFAGNVVGWVPLEIVNEPGTYSVFVRGGNGDSNAVSFTVTKPGRWPFKIHLPELLLEPARSRLGSIIKYDVTATDFEGEYSIKCDPESGSTFPFGKSTIRCQGSDSSGQKDDGAVDVNVFDAVSPSLEIPKDFEVDADSGEGSFVKYETRAFDEIDGDISPNCFPKAESLFRPGWTTVSCEAVDASLNPTYGSFRVMVRPKDYGKLELRVPEGLSVPADFKEGAYVDFEVVAYGSADPDPVVTCEPPSGSFFPVGKTEVRCIAVDDFDQSAEGGFILEVTEYEEMKLADVNAEATGPSGAEVSYTPEVEGWTADIACSPESGSLFALGATTVECESVADDGVKAKGTFTVLVADTIAPHIARVQATPGAIDRARGIVPVAVEVEASDVADVMPRCSVANLVSDNGAFDWRVVSDLALEVNAAPSSNRLFRLQVSCVDSSGNRATEDVSFAISPIRDWQSKTN